MTTTPNNAVSTTSPDMSDAAQSFNERFANDTHFGWKPIDYWIGGYKAALARATPQPPAVVHKLIAEVERLSAALEARIEEGKDDA